MGQILINDVYRPLIGQDGTLRKDVRYFEVYGGRRSGKSYDVAQILGLTAMQEPGHFIPCIRKVGTTLKDSVLAEMAGFFSKHKIQVSLNKTDKEIILSNGSRFRCFGLDDPEKLKSLKDATIIWLEEANELSESDFDSLDAGLSPTSYPGRIITTHNPMPQIPGSMHWLQKRFLQTPHELSKAKIDTAANALILRTWYKDNKFCPKETRKVLENYQFTNPEKYKLWALGEFTKMEGVVFNNWDIVPEVPAHIVHDTIGIGLDFGFSNDPSAAVRGWLVADELWLKLLVYKTGLHNGPLYDELIAAGAGEADKIVADSARPDIIDDLYRRGLLGIKGVKKHGGYKEDIASRMKSYKIHLIEGDTDLIREFSTYSWSRDKNGKQLPKLQDGDDHGIDAAIMLMADHTGGTNWALL